MKNSADFRWLCSTFAVVVVAAILGSCGGGGSSSGGSGGGSASSSSSSSGSSSSSSSSSWSDVRKASLGLNVGSTSDWEGNLLYADAFKSAREFRKVGSHPDDLVTLGTDGWPADDFQVYVWADAPRMNGTYTLSFNGQADVRAELGSNTLSAISYNSANNTSSAVLTFNDSNLRSVLQLVFANTRRKATSGLGSGVTNIKLMRPISQGAGVSHDTTEIFSREFLDIVKRFGVLRTMDFTATNGKTAEVLWSDRVLPDEPAGPAPAGYGWQGKGGAWEYTVMLANEADADIWISIPVAVDDAYVTNLAKLLKYGSDGIMPYNSLQVSLKYPGLETGRHVYVEYANELWNFASAFEQSRWLHNAAIAEVAGGGSNLNYDGQTNDYVWGWRRQARRTVEISNIFRSVWGDDAMMTTIRPVLEWQQPNGQGTADTTLDFIDSWYANGDGNHVTDPHPVSYYVYGGSGSAYYSPDTSSDALTLDNIWSSGTFSTSQWAKDQSIDGSYAAAFGLKRTAYEGGPSMDNFGHSTSILAAAWGDARMKTTIIEHHTLWEQNGGNVLVYFTLGGLDDYQWNFIKNIHDPATDSPKLQATDALLTSAPASVTLGYAVPGSWSAAAFAVAKPSWRTPGSGSIELKSDFNWTSYTLRTTATVTVQPKISYSATGASQVDIQIDGKSVGTMSTDASGGGGTWLAPTGIRLDPGMHGMRLLRKSGNVTITTVGLQ